jgi:hypothetical protein
MILVTPAASSRVSEKIRAFSLTTQKTKSGQPIIAQLVEPRADEFGKFVSQVRPADIIVCDSQQQLATMPALHNTTWQSTQLCGDNESCPALIAPWLPIENQEAAQQVFRALTDSTAR